MTLEITEQKVESIHQTLMDKAYARWISNSDEIVTYDDFVDSLKGDELVAVLVGNFNYQVVNGGLEQWEGNGYSRHSKRLREVLLAMKDLCSLAPVVLGIVEEFEDIMDTDDGLNDEDYWDSIDEYGPNYDELDSRYYEVNEEFMTQCELYLA